MLDRGQSGMAAWELGVDLDFQHRGNQSMTRRSTSVSSVKDDGRNRADRAMGRKL